MTTTTTVSSGQTSSGLTITSGNLLIVLSGGTAASTVVASGGAETLSSGGTTSGTVISTGGLLSGHGSLAGVTTDAGTISGGSVVGGGVVSVTSGGKTNAVIAVNGGTIDVLSGGTATSSFVSSAGGQVISSGGSSVSATVSSGGSEVILKGGIATGATVSSGGYQTLSSGGVAIGTTVKASGTETVASGATALGATLQGGATLSAAGLLLGVILDSGTISGGTIGSGGTTIVTGGRTSGVIVASGGTEIVSGGGTAVGTVLQSGGTLIYAGGGTSGLVVSAGAVEAVASGVSVNSLTVGSGTTLIVSGTDTHATVLSGGTEVVLAGGTSVATLVSSGGTEIISSGGFASGTVVSGGGVEVLGSGGTLAYSSGSTTFSGTLQGGGSLDLTSDTFTYAGPAGSSNVGVVMNGGTLALKASETFGGGFTFSGGGSATIASGTTLTIGGSASLSNAYIRGPGVLDTTGNTSFSYLYLDGGLTLINGGTVTDTGYLLGAYPSGSGSIIISNTASGTFDLVSNSNIEIEGNGTQTFINAGTLAEIGSGTATVAAAITNTGTITAGSGGTLQLNGGGVLGGTIGATGTGTIAFAGGTFTLAGTTQSISGPVNIDGGTISIAKGDTLTLSGAVALPGGSIDGPGTLVTTGVTSLTNLDLDGGLTWVNSGTVTDAGIVYLNYPSETGSVTITNASGGVFDLTSNQPIYVEGSTATFANAGLLEQTGGTATSNIDAAITNTGTILATTGSLEFDGGGTLGGTIGATGTGTIAFGGGTFTLAGKTQTISGPVNIDGGTISIAKGDTLTLSGAVALPGGSIDGPGTLVTAGVTSLTTLYLDDGLTWVNGGTVTDSSAVYGEYPSGSGSITISNTSAGVFDLTSGGEIYNYGTSPETFINGGTLANLGNFTGLVYATVTNTSTGTLTATSGTLELLGGGTLGGTLGATNTKGSVLLDSGAFATAAGTSATIADDGTATGLTLAYGETWTDSGTILDAGHLHIGNLSGESVATLAITSGSSFTLTGADSGIAAVGTTTITNAGTISQTGPTGLDTISVGIANTGLILAATGTLALTGAVSGTGHMQIGGGAALELGQSLSTTQSVTFNGPGATLILEKPASIKLLTNFGTGDRIDLAGITVTAAGTSGDVLTVSVGTTAYTFTSNESLAADHATFASDGAGGTLVTLYAEAVAVASPHAPEPVAFANAHVGDAVTQALTITNAAPAGYSEALDASLGGATTGFATAGTITGLAGGTANSTALTITETTTNPGTLSGTATLSLLSDGTGIDGFGTTALPSQTVTMSGAVYAYAAPSLAATTVNLGAARVGGVLTAGSVTIADGTAMSPYQESLLYGATGPAALTLTNTTGTVTAGSTATLGVSLGTTTAGNYNGSTATIALTSTGAGTSGLASTTLASQTITINGEVFAPAVAQLAGTTVSVGIIHVGDTASATVGVTNAGSGALVDLLTAGTATATGEVSGVSYGGLGTGVTAGSSGTVSLSLNTAAAGTISGSAAIGFDSHDSALADLAIAGGTVTVTGTIDNYAVATVEDTGGAGTLSGSGSAYVLNLGTVSQGAAALTGDLGVINAAVGPADLLGGSFAVSGSTSFANTGTAAFSGLAAGQADTTPVVTLNTGTAGVFTETLVLSAAGSNASGYSGALAAETITVTGTVVSNGTTYTLTGAPTTIAGTTGNDTIDAASNTLNSHDTISGAGGVNTLNLEGSGYFDLGAPATLTDIQIVTAQESAAGTTVYMRNGLTVTLDVTPAGSGSLLIYGGTDSNVYNLGAGSDTVVVGAKSETVNAGGGTALVQATSTLAGVLVNGGSVGSAGTTTLEITNGGTATLNGADTNIIVRLDAATNLGLGSATFITAEGATAGHDTITAGGSSQTLESLGGSDTLVGAASFGDTFLATSLGLAGDTIKTFGGSDTIDITDMVYTSLKTLTYSGNTTSGKLAVTDGTHSVSLTMSGSYTLASFSPASDGHGGTLISFV